MDQESYCCRNIGLCISKLHTHDDSISKVPSWEYQCTVKKMEGMRGARWRKSKTWRSPSFPQIQ